MLSALTLPMHPLFILFLIAATGPAGFWFGSLVAERLRRVSISLLLALALGVFPPAVIGFAIVAIGGHPNAVYVAARYAWVVLGWGGVVGGLVWARRANDPMLLSSQARGQRSSPLSMPSVFAFLVLLMLSPGWFISNRPWSLPYEAASWFFDAYTLDFASDECLAFRFSEGHEIWWRDPSLDAGLTLRSYGAEAVPGTQDFLMDQLHHGEPKGGAMGLLVRIAQYGDSEALEAYETKPYFQTKLMRSCLSAGHKVESGGPAGWRCTPPIPTDPPSPKPPPTPMIPPDWTPPPGWNPQVDAAPPAASLMPPPRTKN